MILFFFFVMIVTVSCGKLQYDDTVAFRLMTVSSSPSPRVEDIRAMVYLDDLVYLAAGSGGILVYRIVGDIMNPVLSLSLTNLYSESLEEVFVRTVEIVKTEKSTNIVFAYDTLSGGGIGIAEISPEYTKPLGSLKTEEGIRIKDTVTSYNPLGFFHVLAASENVGVVSYQISFLSNSYFEQPKIASLVDYVSLLDIESPVQNFLSFVSPESLRITNIGQITNIETLIKLAFDNPQLFSSIVPNIPFLTKEQKERIIEIVSLTNKPVLSDILNAAEEILGKDVVNQVLANPNAINTLLNSNVLKDVSPNLLNPSNQSSDLIQSITPGVVNQAQAILTNNTNGNNISQEEIQNVLSLSGLQNAIAQNNVLSAPSDTVVLENKETETLFEESLLSNITAGQINNGNENPFINRQQIENARVEIQKTVNALGRTFFIAENQELKNKVLELNPEELSGLFSVLFQQANTAISLIPLLQNAGININDIYRLWLQGDYAGIVNSLDSTVIAEILRQLPRYKVDTDFQIKQTNFVLPTINRMHADETTLYVSAGLEGFFIVDRLSGMRIDFYKKEFSDVTMVIPYNIYGRKFYAVTDTLDGLGLYKRNNNKTIGEQVSRIALVGESLSVFPYDNILWVADGSNGVLAVRVDKDNSLIIEAELYQKEGIAYDIGAAYRREVLASYGADGLKRLRITNAITNQTFSKSEDFFVNDTVIDQEEQGDFIDKILDWGQYSLFAQFIRRVFLL